MKWEVETLENLCRHITDGVHHRPTYIESGVPFLSVKNLTKGFIDFSNTKFISIEEHHKLIRRCNPEIDDVLYTKVGTTGVAKVVDTDKQFSLFVSVALLKPQHDIIFNKYLEYYLNSDLGRKQAQKRTRGMANKNLVIRDIKKIKVAYPIELEEQKRIVEILDESFAQIEKAETIARQNLTNARELFDSYFNKLFTKKNNQWKSINLSQVASFRNGLNFTKNSQGESIKIVGVKDFKDFFWLNEDNLDTVTINGNLKDIDRLEENDILVVRSNGNKELIGRCILVGHISEKTSHSGFTIRVRFNANDSIFHPFVIYFLKSNEMKRQLIDSGGGISISSISQKGLASIELRLPSLEEQKRIVFELDEINKYSSKLEAIYQCKIKALEELKQSILHKAFTGQLTQ